MADVGVLNLQIQDNSEKAVAGLDSLVGALGRVKGAIEGGMKLSSVATGLKNLGKAIDDNIHGSTIVKLGQLADELSKLKGLGNINIKINGGSSIESIMDAIKEAQADMSGINTGFDEIGARAYDASGGIGGFNNTVRETEQLMQSTAWGNGVEQFRELLEQMSRLRMAFSLPAGAQTGMTTEVETGFQMMKEGAIEVEGTVTDAMENVAQRLGEPIKYLTGMSSQLGDINDYLEHTNGLMDDLARKSGTAPTEARSIILYQGGRSELEEELERINEQALETKATLDSTRASAEALDEIDYTYNNWGSTPPAKPDVNSEKAAIDYVNELVESATKIDLVNMRIDALRDKLVDGVNTGSMTADQIAQNVEKLRELEAELKKLENSSGKLGEFFSGLGKGISKLGVVKLLSRFASVALGRSMRYVIKQIAAGFSEGVQNVYNYSNAIGSSFAPAMDAAASSMLQFKNSIGAAVSPLISALVPALQTVVTWLINGINYLNQFFALLNNQKTWTRALPATTTAFKNQEKAAKGAGAAIKDLLADWDELNIIQSESGGGGGSSAASAAEDYLNMFEEVGKFDNKIKDIIDFIKDNLGEIEYIAGAIGATLLAWRLSNAFLEALPILSKVFGAVGTIGTILITLGITDLTGKQYANTGEPGWLIADALTGALGATLAWTMAKKIAGGAVASVTSGITLTLAAMVNVKNALGAAAQQQFARWGMLTVLASVESGIGAALIAKGIGLTTAFAFGLGVTAAVATIGISVGALIQMSKDSIEWGEVTLTNEDVETFVSNKMFKDLSVSATVDLIEVTVKKISESKKDIQDQVASLMPTINALRLGVDKKSSYEELKKQIFGNEQEGTQGLISQIQTYAETNVQELKTTFAIIPVIDESGKDVSAEFMQSGITGWGEVDAYVKQLGVDLGTELSKGFTEDGLAKFDEEAVKAITDKMVKISQIITGSQIESAAQADLSMGMSDLMLGDLDKESVNKVVKLFDEYKGQLEQEYTKIYKDAANQYMILSRFYAETGNETMAKFYKDQYDDLIEKMPQSVSDAVKSAAGPGLDMIYDFLHEKFGDVFEKLGVNIQDGGSGAFHQWIAANFEPNKDDIEKSASDFNVALANWLGGENMFLNELLKQMPNLNVWDMLSEEMQNSMYGILKERYGEEFADKLVRTYAPELEDAVEQLAESVPDIEVENEIDLKTTINQETETPNEIINGADSPVVSAKENLDALTESAKTADSTVDSIKLNFDTNGVEASANSAASAIENMASRIRKAFASLDGLTYEMDISGQKYSGAMKVLIPSVEQRASGGFVRSGDLVMANENGNFEMMGRMGNQPVVANNQQIVNGISQGVATANGDVVSELRTLTNLMQKMLNKEFVAKAIPGSDWGQHNSRSNDAWGKVNG